MSENFFEFEGVEIGFERHFCHGVPEHVGGDFEMALAREFCEYGIEVFLGEGFA